MDAELQTVTSRRRLVSWFQWRDWQGYIRDASLLCWQLSLDIPLVQAKRYLLGLVAAFFRLLCCACLNPPDVFERFDLYKQTVACLARKQILSHQTIYNCSFLWFLTLFWPNSELISHLTLNWTCVCMNRKFVLGKEAVSESTSQSNLISLHIQSSWKFRTCNYLREKFRVQLYFASFSHFFFQYMVDLMGRSLNRYLGFGLKHWKICTVLFLPWHGSTQIAATLKAVMLFSHA